MTTFSLTGVSTSSNPGSFGFTSTRTLTGVSTTTLVGRFLPYFPSGNITINFQGVSTITSIGNFELEIIFPLVGVKAEAITGEFNPIIYNENGFSLSKFEIIPIPEPITDVELSMIQSDNSGATYSQPQTYSIGLTGEYDKVVHFHQLGIARNKVLGISSSSPTKIAIVGVGVEAKESNS